ncbi:MAG TPA: DUF1684 domain-containing protein [Stellaceae bacterium]|jgi:hypothetical protein|nr:DUF1684 domain-containing protein [Stellaceae bacterium]
MRDDTSPALSRLVALWGWRRQIAELYAGIRAAAAPEAAWQEWRRTRDALFRAHPQSPLAPHKRAAFRSLPYFAHDPALRFLVELETPPDASAETMTAGADGTVTLLPFARTRGLTTALGGELTLYWISIYGGGVFLPFRDATSGKTSYAGGRYLLDTIKGADLGMVGERVVLDFNFAYNPSCAYSDQWICPLAPPANTLPRSVAAGERMDRELGAS